ncbi:LPXTG cell wall anchor domain-containing protein, partial [Listeria monocytogenes]|nr:LPXTG cell wall anchor domain-containing protein [Listeria monocytogenes]
NITMTQKAAPIVLVTPIFLLDANGEQTNTKLSNVHIYPKNIGYVPNKPDKPIPPDNPKKPSKPVLPMTGQAKSFLSLLGIAIILAVVWIWRKKTKK